MSGVIAGSEGSLLSPHGYLDHDAYVNLSPRMYPVFASHREVVYGMFVSYLNRKRELDDYDLADRYVFTGSVQFPDLIIVRTHTIIRSVVKESVTLQKVSHL